MRFMRDLPALAILACGAALFVWFWDSIPGGLPAFDIYMYYEPNMRYAADRLAAGGSGLLWNAWQSCGEPAFGISSTGYLYPVNLLYLACDPNAALRLVSFANLFIGGVGAYALARELGTGRAAALCGGLAFALGSSTLDLNTWGPQMGAGFVWLPWAMRYAERTLRQPSYGSAVGLGLSLTLALLPGFPQTVFYAYQLIALRALYELASRRAAWQPAPIAWLAAGLALAPLLAAVHLLPGIESAALSVRGGALSPTEMQPGPPFTWASWLRQIDNRFDLFNPLVIVPAAAAGAWWIRRATRRVGLFYLLAALLYLALALGDSTPLFDLYRRLPMGSLFREPPRFTWISGFCLAVLCALGVDALLRPGVRWRVLPAAAVAAALIGLNALAPRGLMPLEWLLGGVLVLGGLLANCGTGWQAGGSGLAVAAIACGLLAFSVVLPTWSGAHGWFGAVRSFPLRRLIDSAVLDHQRDALRRFAARLGPQDRAYFVYRHGDFTFMPKSGSLVDLPVAQDYEPQGARRYADFYTMLRTGRPLQNLNQYYYPLTGPQPLMRPLLDLTAARYVVVVEDPKVPVDRSWLVPLDTSGDRRLTLYENPAALPRARWVPGATLVEEPARLLGFLADRRVDPRRTLLLEAPPPSGFLGAPGAAADGAVVFERNDPEHLVLRVRAPAAGFLQLADQYAPGWTATVDGAPAPILRADYLFRAVEVPAGESVVEFRYRPTIVLAGGAVSAATVASLLGIAYWRRRRRVAG